MSRPRLLDLFCGAGGCSVGYHRAGFDVVGVDIVDHPDYPFDLIVADALDVLADIAYLASFDVVHASPPCQAYGNLAKLNASRGYPTKHLDLIPPVRRGLLTWSGPYIIENIPGAPLRRPVRLCGSSFGLGVRRHRWFESTAHILGQPCQHRHHAFVGIYGDHPESGTIGGDDGYERAPRAATIDEARAAMGIDWMGWDDITEAIPPAYTEYIGTQLLDQLAAAS